MVDKKEIDEMFERIKDIKNRDQDDLIDALDFQYSIQNSEFSHLKSMYKHTSKRDINLDPSTQNKVLAGGLMQIMKIVDQGLEKVNKQIEKHQKLLKGLQEQKVYLEKVVPKKYQKAYFEAKKTVIE
jgi:hypothetical protein